MAVCDKIRNGLDMTCGGFPRRFYQQAVIVNRSDIKDKLIETANTGRHTQGEECRHRVSFDLLENTTGYRFSIGENATAISGTAEKIVSEGIPQYNHTVNIVIMGATEESKCILKRFDTSDYFAALQIGNTIEIYGFEYGLGTNNYTYDPQTTGGAVLKLVSLSDSPEDELPFVYKSGTPGNEILDFDNNFAENVFEIQGDYNDDFSNDFNNEQ